MDSRQPFRTTLAIAVVLTLTIGGCGAPTTPTDGGTPDGATPDGGHASDGALDGARDGGDGGSMTMCPGGCLVAGTCHPDGATNPANPCEICRAAMSATAFSANDGATCDDGMFCTTGDLCVGTACHGTARSCDDGIACNGTETCSETTHMCAAGTSTCTGAEVCDATSGVCVVGCSGCVVSATCYGDGQVSPLDPCQRCHVATSTTAFSPNDGGSCDDGIFCTRDDVCTGGTCTAGPARCDDGVACNGAETCNETTNMCVAALPTCAAGQICDLATDMCVATCTGCVIGGSCFGAGQRNPSNQCEVCAPAVSTTTFTPNDGSSCDDGRFCTTGDTCMGTVCLATPRVCSDGIACNGTETCNEATGACAAGTSTCAGGTLCSPATDMCVTTCSGCTISGSCYGSGQVNPTNACEVCDPAASSSAWSANDGARCDDGLFCTDGDTCNARACSGNPRVCSDGVSCNGTETCDETGNVCTRGPTTCASTEVCDTTSDRCVTTCAGCTIAGVCYAAGTSNPTNQCQVCDIARSISSFSPNDGASCDDGLFCTRGDVCSGGLCAGSATNFCADAVTCNGTETCNETTDSCVPGATTCAGGQVCDSASNMCVTACSGCVIGGVCYAASTINPTNQCQICNTSAPTVWSANTGGACNDGLFCTAVDTCTASAVCTGTMRVCDDGVACNGTETCNESTDRCDAGTTLCPGGQVCDTTSMMCITTCAGCVISGVCYAPNAINPSNQCQACRTLVTTTAWTPVATGSSCDDGLYCTVGDACSSGAVCVGGSARSCADAITCNGTETCNESTDRCDPGATTCPGGQVCDPTTPPGTCLTTCSGCVVGGVCYAPNTVNPMNQCQSCQVAASTTAWTNVSAGTPCDDGLYCTVGEACSAGAMCTGGSARNCADGIACNGAETCNEAADRCDSGTTTCPAGQVCDPTTPPGMCVTACSGCVIAGVCYAPNTVNPANQCQTCRVSSSTTAWTNVSAGTACDDGLYCTVGEACSAGATCTAGSARNCSDGVACNGTETCNEGTDRCDTGTPTCPAGQRCDVMMNMCVTTCSGCLIAGVCQAAGAIDPTNQCQSCQTGTSTTAWTPRTGAACDDGMYCTLGETCSAGATCGSGMARVCSDGIACNGAETCNEATDRCDAGSTTCTGGRICNTMTDMCVLMCVGGTTLCSGMCTNTAFDPMNCNTCGMVCPAAPNATPTCISSACSFACNSGYRDCTAAAGCETNSTNDPLNCATCGHVCAGTMNGTATCTSSVCGIVCNAGFQDNDMNGTCLPACAPGTCSGHGTCSDASGPATCTCSGCYSGSDCSVAPAFPCGVMHCWPGEGSGTDVVSGDNASVQPDVTYAAGRSGSAFHCSGASGGGTPPTTDAEAMARPIVSPTGPWTYEMWIRRSSSTGDAWIFDRQYRLFSVGGAPLVDIHTDSSGNSIFYIRDDGGTAVSSPGFVLTMSVWVHVAVTRSGSTISYYVNGALIGTSSLAGTLTPDPPRWCGHIDSPGSSMVGEIDSIRIWDRALSPSEVANVAAGDGSCTAYAAVTPPVTSGLLAQYNARVSSSMITSGSSVTQWQDLSGNAYHLGPIFGTPVLGATLINSLPAVDMTGAGMRVGGVPLAAGASITVFVAMQQRTPAQWGAIVHHGNRDGDWSMEQSGFMPGSVQHFQSVNDNANCNLTLTTGSNYVLTGRITGATRYFSSTAGGSTTSTTCGGNSIGPANLNFYTGVSDNMEHSNAYIGEILYYNRSLTDVERDSVIAYLASAWSI